jgi:hypothetical protein
MSATTVVTDEATIISEDDSARVGRSSFSWGAALIGAFIAAAVTFLLIALGSGVGLALVTTPKLLHGAAPTFFTLGAIYFFAAQAFGFAVGGHVTGRLIGMAVETPKEEEFRAGAHGLGVWAIGVVLTVTMAAIAAFVAEGSAPSAAGAYAMTQHNDNNLSPMATSYWVDTLFRGAPVQQASIDGMKFAQASSTTGTDAAPAVSNDQPAAQQTAPTAGDDESSGAQTVTPQTQSAAPSDIQIPASSGAATPSTAAPAAMGTPAAGRNVIADKAEAGRILDVGLAKAGDVAPDDRAQLATLVSLDTGMTYATAQRRVDDVLARIRTEEVKTAEVARKVASYASLWAAFSLLFGAIVSVFAAISARWEDDRISIFGR